MIIYSNKIIQFMNEIKEVTKKILFFEVKLRVKGDRFYDKQNQTSYPIKIVIFNHKHMLGYFDPSFYELGFHESLMHSSKENLINVVRHELAHYIIHINDGESTRPHSPKFRAFCQKMGWGEEVYRATGCNNEGNIASSIEENGIFRKIQKLMALATSSNKNEAEQAMIKSQQLLLKHNMDSAYLGHENEEKICLKRIMEQKKENAKMRAIAHILGTFFVSVVYNRSTHSIFLEILGSETNVDIAEYVANFLSDELENLWKRVQKTSHLKGLIAKNSFFYGIATGYCSKIEELKNHYPPNISGALLVIEKKLNDAKTMVYPRLKSVRSNGNHCLRSSMIGEQMGRKLNINPAVRKSSNTCLMLAHSTVKM